MQKYVQQIILYNWLLFCWSVLSSDTATRRALFQHRKGNAIPLPCMACACNYMYLLNHIRNRTNTSITIYLTATLLNAAFRCELAAHTRCLCPSACKGIQQHEVFITSYIIFCENLNLPLPRCTWLAHITKTRLEGNVLNIPFEAGFFTDNNRQIWKKICPFVASSKKKTDDFQVGSASAGRAYPQQRRSILWAKVQNCSP